jgi:hypothetical protein
MVTAEKHEPGAIPPDVLADAQAVIEHVMSGKPLDPEVARRVHERAAKITDEIRRKHGVLDIGVPAIRELRGELPE